GPAASCRPDGPGRHGDPSAGERHGRRSSHVVVSFIADILRVHVPILDCGPRSHRVAFELRNVRMCGNSYIKAFGQRGLPIGYARPPYWSVILYRLPGAAETWTRVT